MFQKQLHWMLSMGFLVMGCGKAATSRVGADGAADAAGRAGDAGVDRDVPTDEVAQARDVQAGD